MLPKRPASQRTGAPSIRKDLTVVKMYYVTTNGSDEEHDAKYRRRKRANEFLGVVSIQAEAEEPPSPRMNFAISSQFHSITV